MQVNEVPELANGKRLLVNRHTGQPVKFRLNGVVELKPGLGELKFYKGLPIEDVGTLVIMSDDSHTRYYLFSDLYRGSVVYFKPSRTLHDALLGLKGALGMVIEETISQGAMLFRNRIRTWLLAALLGEGLGLSLCKRRMWINRVTGFPVSLAEACSTGHLEKNGRRGFLISPCVDTFLQGEIISYFSFKLEHGTVAVVSTGEVTCYIFLGGVNSSYSLVRARFKGGVTTEEQARKLVLVKESISSPIPVAVVKLSCRNIGEAPLLASFV